MTSWQQVKKQIQTVLCDPGPLLCYVSIPGPWSEKVLLCAGESAGGSVRWLWMRQTLWTSVCQLHSHHNTGQNHCDDTQRYLESQNEAQSGRNRLSPSWLHLTLRKEWRGGAEASYWNKTTELKATKLADANKLPVLSTLATDTHACVNSQTELQNMTVFLQSEVRSAAGSSSAGNTIRTSAPLCESSQHTQTQIRFWNVDETFFKEHQRDERKGRAVTQRGPAPNDASLSVWKWATESKILKKWTCGSEPENNQEELLVGLFSAVD